MQDDRIYLTESDCEVIRKTLQEFPEHALSPFLRSELLRARILPEEEIPENVVTLHSRVQVLEELSGIVAEIIPVPPSMAQPSCGYVSVLAPAGAAVIGMSLGQVLEWRSAANFRKRYRVIDVPFQPEAENRICIAS